MVDHVTCVHVHSLFLSAGFKCPVCSKFVSSEEMDLHLVLCLTKPRVTYNGITDPGPVWVWRRSPPPSCSQKTSASLSLSLYVFLFERVEFLFLSD